MSVCNSPNSEAAAKQTPPLGMRLSGAAFEVHSRSGCVSLLRLYSDCFFGLARTSVIPCFHAICGKSNKRLKEYLREQEYLRAVGERKDGDGRVLFLKKMGAYA